MQKNNLFTITNCTILTVDGEDRFFPRGRMTVQGNSILRVGHELELPLEGDVIDMQSRLVLPGLVNTHTHSHSSLFKNQADDLQLQRIGLALSPRVERLIGDQGYAQGGGLAARGADRDLRIHQYLTDFSQGAAAQQRPQQDEKTQWNGWHGLLLYRKNQLGDVGDLP